MAKKVFKCVECGHTATKWLAQCPQCGQIDTMEEAQASVLTTPAETKPGSRAHKNATGDTATLVQNISADNTQRIETGIGELDRVLGGGMVPGGIIFLAGAPGVGKSSVSNLLASNLSAKGMKTLIVSGEETKHQIKSRLERINANMDNMYLLSESNLNNVRNEILALNPAALIIDSVQTLISDTSEGRVGSVSQVTDVAQTMTYLGKTLNIPVILIGHVTKDGNLAGPRVVEHLVDAVLMFEGTKDSNLRLLRGIKNRYGATDEIGCFEHAADGLHEVTDPSGFFLNEHDDDVVGYATSILIEGNRALPVEIQALVTPSPLPNPRKVNHGVENSRVLMVQAIVEKYGNARMSDKDVYVSTTGGLVAKDTSVDLAVAASLISSYLDIPLPPNTVVLGETTLTGETRQPRDAMKRIQEAKRLGFTNILTPLATTYQGDRDGVTTIRNIGDLVTVIKDNER